MNIYLIFIPFLNALIAWLSVVAFWHILFHRILPRKQNLIRQALLEKIQMIMPSYSITQKIEELDLEKEVAPLLDQRLDQLIAQLKGQIPMGNVLLSGSLTEGIKRRIKEEILRTLPELKERLAKKIEAEFNLEQIIEQHVQQLQLSSLQTYLQKEMSQEMTQLQGLAALTGFTIGLVNLLFFYIFN